MQSVYTVRRLGMVHAVVHDHPGFEMRFVSAMRGGSVRGRRVCARELARRPERLDAEPGHTMRHLPPLSGRNVPGLRMHQQRTAGVRAVLGLRGGHASRVHTHVGYGVHGHRALQEARAFPGVRVAPAKTLLRAGAVPGRPEPVDKQAGVRAMPGRHVRPERPVVRAVSGLQGAVLGRHTMRVSFGNNTRRAGRMRMRARERVHRHHVHTVRRGRVQQLDAGDRGHLVDAVQGMRALSAWDGLASRRDDVHKLPTRRIPRVQRDGDVRAMRDARTLRGGPDVGNVMCGLQYNVRPGLLPYGMPSIRRNRSIRMRAMPGYAGKRNEYNSNTGYYKRGVRMEMR